MPGRTVAALERRYGARGSDVLDLLRSAAAEEGIGPEQIRRIAEQTGIPAAHVHGAASFYSDLGFDPAPARSVRVCTGTACFAAGGGERARE
jgi:bidirectional [NiFe] hydrogenase diaphorase subunit